MDATTRQRLWQVAKLLITAVVLAFVGRTFLQALDQLPADFTFRPQWLVLSGGLYVLGMLLSVAFWVLALRALGQRPGWGAAARAYLVGSPGKYVPGKAMVIVVRAGLVAGPRVRLSVAALTVVYETLLYMAVGALLAAVLTGLQWEVGQVQAWHVLALLAVAGVPTLPWVFNPMARRVVRRFQQPGEGPLPDLPVRTLLAGMALEAGQWFLTGLSLWAAVQAVQAVPFDGPTWSAYTAVLGIATVASFFTPIPGGLGVREWLLQWLLSPTLGEGPAVLVAVLFRLTWIVSEVATAAALYWLPLVPLETAAGRRQAAAEGLAERTG
jgi:uncharacterized membrane protein YbhN (UPF0104 family)